MNCEDCIYTYPDCPYGDKYDLPIDDSDLCPYKEVQLGVVFPKKIVPVNLKIEKIYKHKSDFSDIEEIEDL